MDKKLDNIIAEIEDHIRQASERLSESRVDYVNSNVLRLKTLVEAREVLGAIRKERC